MKTCFKSILFAAAVLCFSGAAAKSERLDLLHDGSFKPVRMNNRITALRGWVIYDYPRRDFVSKYHNYLSGDGLFEFTEDEGGFVKLTFPEKLHEAYVKPKRKFTLEPAYGLIPPPADYYRITGKVKVTGGSVEMSNKFKIAPSPEWQKIDFKGRFPDRIYLNPAAGASFTFADIVISAEYKKTGSISLPDGGTLSKILVNKNASLKERRGVSMWRGWLYQLTGKALAVETREKTAPEKDALVILEDPEMTDSWTIKVDKDSVVLKCKDYLSAVPALFDFLRKELNHTEYTLNTTFYGLAASAGPAAKSVKQLPKCSRSMKLKFDIISSEDYAVLLNGGVHRTQFFANTMVHSFYMTGPAPYHILNVLLPMEKYYKSNPEYFMQNATGKRVVHVDPGLNHPCFSDPAVAKIIADNLVEYANAQLPDRSIVNFNSGDSSENCYCKKCSNINHSLVMNKVLEDAASRLRKGQYIARSAYASRRTAPEGRHPNIMYHYCLDLIANPCTLHVDCALNQPMIKEIKSWRKSAGGKEFLGFSTYRDRRPIFHLKQLEMLSKYGCQSLHFFVWHGYSPAIPFVTGRWNMGEDPMKLVKEFDHVYFGKGGPAMHKITLLVEEFAANYKHTPEELNSIGSRHIAIFGGRTNSTTVLDRKTLDKIYLLFDEALKAETDKTIRGRIELEKVRYLLEDLTKYNRINCALMKDDAGFQNRLVEFIRIARTNAKKLDPVWFGVSGRNFIMSVSGISVSNTGKPWFKEAEIENIIKDPAKAFSSGVEEIPGGWYYRPTSFKGKVFAKEYSHNCPPRVSFILSRPSLGKADFTAELELKQDIKTPVLLSVEGLDDDKPGKSLFKVEVNGKVLYNGAVEFPENEWGRMGFTVPANTLKAGKNTISISNTTPDFPSRSARFAQASDGAGDAQWGWLMISELYLHDPSGDFRNMAAGKKGTFWAQTTAFKPMGKVDAADGKIKLTGNGTRFTGIRFASSLIYPKPALHSSSAIKIKVKVSGKGKFIVGCNGYTYGRKNGSQIITNIGYGKRWDRWGNGGYVDRKIELTPEEKEYTFTFTKTQKMKAFSPLLAVMGDGNAVISDVEVEIVPAKR